MVLADLDPYGGARRPAARHPRRGVRAAVRRPARRRWSARRPVRLGLPGRRRPPGRGHRPAARRPVAGGAGRHRSSSCSSGPARHGHVVVDTGFSLEDDTGVRLRRAPGPQRPDPHRARAGRRGGRRGRCRPGGTRPARPRAGRPARPRHRRRPCASWSTGCGARSGGRRRRSPAWSRASAGSPDCTSCPTTAPALDRALVSGRPVADLGDSPLVHAVAALADAVFPAHARGGADGPSVRTRLRRGRGPTGHGGGRRSARST